MTQPILTLSQAIRLATMGVSVANSYQYNLRLLNATYIDQTSWPDDAVLAIDDYGPPHVWAHVLNRIAIDDLSQERIKDASQKEVLMRADIQADKIDQLMRANSSCPFALVWHASQQQLTIDQIGQFDPGLLIYFASRNDNSQLVARIISALTQPIELKCLVFISREQVCAIRDKVTITCDESDEEACILARRHDLLSLVHALTSAKTKSNYLLGVIALSDECIVRSYLSNGLSRVMPSPIESIERAYDEYGVDRINLLDAIAQRGIVAIKQAMAKGVCQYNDTSLVRPDELAFLRTNCTHVSDAYILHPLYALESLLVLSRS